MTNSHSSSEPDDRPIASLLKRLDHDAPSPDLAALDAIGVLAAAVFDDAGDTSEMCPQRTVPVLDTHRSPGSGIGRRYADDRAKR